MTAVARGVAVEFPQHELRTWPRGFRAVLSGLKRYELRRNDRAFRVGDLLRLREWDPTTNRYSGRWVDVAVTLITEAGEYPGLEDGFCIMGIEPMMAGNEDGPQNITRPF